MSSSWPDWASKGPKPASWSRPALVRGITAIEGERAYYSTLYTGYGGYGGGYSGRRFGGYGGFYR
ncbi:MAG: hypothetical protein R3C10_01965 [Pirellulales bacterium]